MGFDKERAEAISAGNAAISSLEKARNMLASARGWGIYDTFFKGGLVSGLIKHSKMNRAEECIRQAKHDLERFNNELRDIDLMVINLDTKDLLGFADILCDGFLTDILMQNRIKEACSQVDLAISKVKSITTQLKSIVGIIPR